MVKQVDTADLKSAVYNERAGSTPAPDTKEREVTFTQAWERYISEGGKPEHKEAFTSGWFLSRQELLFKDEPLKSIKD